MERLGVAVPTQTLPETTPKVFYVHAGGMCFACTNQESIRKWVDYSLSYGYSPKITLEAKP